MRCLQPGFQRGDEGARLSLAAKTDHMLIELDLPRAGGVSARRTYDNFHRCIPPGRGAAQV
ncbi:protein of unknown function [Pseudomonas putida KT2440]|uniref:Uncharacterized protein n=1 Tax=Pseudomonas putida (strain ATCC 47054 / DSM 6125 / CFBP 8728 / NCIMB 11950 / KT2440) TaxID=160488 RepID=A0A140FVZ3_PSEPK|nr:protein of unknown function [Pseudomonas putida KT2440]